MSSKNSTRASHSVVSELNCDLSPPFCCWEEHGRGRNRGEGDRRGGGEGRQIGGRERIKQIILQAQRDDIWLATGG